MSPSQKKRLSIIFIILAGVSLAAVLALKAMRANLEYFLTPEQISSKDYKPQQRYRIAGMVKKGSVKQLDDGITSHFILTDCVNDVSLQYTGILPDLFREGQAIVANGHLNNDGLFIAAQVLAKHDENYVPNEAAETMMKAQANQCETRTSKDEIITP